MNKVKISKITRKSHRYLGIIFGIQFLFWTLGGMYFSWTNLKEIRGENIRKEEPSLKFDFQFISPDRVLNEIKKENTINHLKSFQLIDLLGEPFYQVSFDNNQRIKTILANAKTGELKEALSESEAIAVAKSRLKTGIEPLSVKYIRELNKHHEYRNKPLPAYAITFNDDIKTTVYVSSEMGTVQTFRNNSWRVFDFLWMLHTMDYEERDNFNNWTLRVFSTLGLITIISGFLLFFLTTRKNLRKKINQKSIL